MFFMSLPQRILLALVLCGAVIAAALWAVGS
jgi:hypothetical protein